MSSEEGRRPDEPGTGATDDRPHLEVRDPKMMRALAHPLRVALIEAISQADTQTLTATEASELLGESPANCAFHLRTLAKYGFLEEAGGGRGRERPWRLRFRGLELAPPWQDPESRLAAEAAASVWLDRWLTRARDRLMRVLGYPAAWQDASVASQRGLYLTAQEARDMSKAVQRLLEPFEKRWQQPSLRPPGSLRYEVLLLGYPLTDPPASPDPASPPGPAGSPGLADSPGPAGSPGLSGSPGPPDPAGLAGPADIAGQGRQPQTSQMPQPPQTPQPPETPETRD
jgi:predicted transcriptional regulator